MTTPNAMSQIEKSRARGGSLLLALAIVAEAASVRRAISWPALEYQADPVAFFREVLGVEPWRRQIEVLEAIRDHGRVAVRSGHKIGKTTLAVGAGLWFYESFPDARVLMTAPTARQVDRVLWRELRKLHARALVPLDGEPGQLAKTGIVSPDLREMWGFTATEAESVAGTSGANMLYIVDEASGVGDAIFEAIEGNRASGTIKVLLLSNPTKTEGEFFEAFDTKAKFYRTFTISSEETPNAVEGRVVVPGLASRSWIEEKREEWGEESALYTVRVKGEHALGEDGKILSVAAILEATQRWEDTPATGRLQIGLDPAGPGLGGDETVFAVRRGKKLLRLYAFRGLSDDAHVAQLLGIIAEHRLDRDPVPLVCVDREGPIGGTVYGALRGYVNHPDHADAFEVVGVRSSPAAIRRPDAYDRVRDELWANLRDWIREGGALVDDGKLQKELNAPEWIQHSMGRVKVTPKDELREKLKRSPDRADALALAVWVPVAFREETLGPAVENGPRPAATSATAAFEPPDPETFNPYAALSAWGR